MAFLINWTNRGSADRARSAGDKVKQQLSHDELRWHYVDFQTAGHILKQKWHKKPGKFGAIAQDRALSALDLGLGIKQRGYNIFVVGALGTGKSSTVEKILRDKASKESTPNDLVLLYNFEDRDRPLAISLPTAHGPKLKKSYELLMEKVIHSLERALESDQYVLSKQALEDSCRKKTADAMHKIENEAKEQAFVLSNNGVSITITPANKKGEPITENEFEKLSEKQKSILEQKAAMLEIQLEDAMRKIRLAEKESEDAFLELEIRTAKKALGTIFENMRHSWKSYKQITAHLLAMEEDIMARIKRFIPEERSEQALENEQNKPIRRRKNDEDDDTEYDEPLYVRYRVNVLVSHARTGGAPVIFETHPTSSNLIGRIEQRLKAGETITDFTRIRAGALYKANGGYLILEASELLRDAGAWEGLKRALKNRVIELDDPGEPGRMIALASLRPEPVPLNLKVILIGAPDIYYALSKNDPDFQSLFKVKADFETEVDRSDENLSKYLQFFATLLLEENLLKLSPEGAGRILEEAVRMSGQNKKITCRLGEVADILREANFWAKKSRAKKIAPEHVRAALNAKSEREGFVESQVIEDIKSSRIAIDISGKVIGQANALTVVEVGSYEFGLPLRVTCQISTGKGQIIDIEREAEQGGPFHIKGRLIIRGLLSKLFGQNLPFGFYATLCMEQTYSEVDGDSASMAEACALLSALSGIPLDQKFAMTGSIDQMGNIQAVGGINEKIEGFYHVIKAKKSQSVHSVLIPRKNVEEIMLKEEVVEKNKSGVFNIISVDTIEDAMESLTGVSFDKGKDSIKSRCLATLKHFNKLRESEHDHASLKKTRNGESLKDAAIF